MDVQQVVFPLIFSPRFTKRVDTLWKVIKIIRFLDSFIIVKNKQGGFFLLLINKIWQSCKKNPREIELKKLFFLFFSWWCALIRLPWEKKKNGDLHIPIFEVRCSLEKRSVKFYNLLCKKVDRPPKRLSKSLVLSSTIINNK